MRCAEPGCDKGARGGSGPMPDRCRAHGGGERCQEPGCDKSADGPMIRWKHGGGKRCLEPGCRMKVRIAGRCLTHGSERQLKVKQHAGALERDSTSLDGAVDLCEAVLEDLKKTRENPAHNTETVALSPLTAAVVEGLVAVDSQSRDAQTEESVKKFYENRALEAATSSSCLVATAERQGCAGGLESSEVRPAGSVLESFKRRIAEKRARDAASARGRVRALESGLEVARLEVARLEAAAKRALEGQEEADSESRDPQAEESVKKYYEQQAVEVAAACASSAEGALAADPESSEVRPAGSVLESFKRRISEKRAREAAAASSLS